jgi:hypothetical protein
MIPRRLSRRRSTRQLGCAIDRLGFKVNFTITGTITVLTAPQKMVGPQDLRVANIAGIFTAGSNQVPFQTAKTEITPVEPDGTVLTSIAGKSVEFTGLQLKTNLETDETIMINEPHVTNLDSICKQLKS